MTTNAEPSARAAPTQPARTSAARVPLPGNWPKLKAWLDLHYPETLSPAKTEWTWDIGEEGYKGVYIAGDKLTWYDHQHHRLASGWGEDQSVADFLEHGPRFFPPDDAIIHELYRAVRQGSPCRTKRAPDV